MIPWYTKYEGKGNKHLAYHKQKRMIEMNIEFNATMNNHVDGYAISGDRVKVERKVGSCYKVQTRHGYSFLALGHKLKLDDVNIFRKNKCNECEQYDNKHKYTCSEVYVEPEE